MEREGDSGRLRELARQAERSLDNQIRVLDEHDAKSRHLLLLIAGALGVSAALVGLLERMVSDYRAAVIISLLLAFICFSIAFLYLGGAYIGSKRNPNEYNVGWKPEDIVKADKMDLDLAGIYRGTIHAVEEWFESNGKKQKEPIRRRRRSFAWFGVGLSFLALAIAITAIIGVI